MERLKDVIIRKDGLERLYEITETMQLPSCLAIKFAGVDSPEDARRLSGGELLVSRKDAAPLRQGEYYVEDLRGLEVFLSTTGETIGIISDVMEGGGGSLIEIFLHKASLDNTVSHAADAECVSKISKKAAEKKLVPFRKEFFGLIDLEKGRAELLNTWILE